MIGKSYAKIAIVGFVLCLAMVLCASFARYRSEQSFIDGAENGFGIDGMYVNDGATKPSMAILAGEDMEWQICNDDGSCMSGRLAATSDPNSFDLLDNDEIEDVFDQLNISRKNKGRVYAKDIDKLRVSSKIPFAYNYIDQNFVVDHDHDGEGEHAKQ